MLRNSKNTTIVFLIAMAAVAFNWDVFAANPPARCYRFSNTKSPMKKAKVAPKNEVWCYQTLTGSQGGLYIFKGDESEVLPELAIVKSNNGTLTHGSLINGKRSMHSTRFEDFNPFPMPLQEPTELPRVSPKLTSEFLESAKSTLTALLHAQSAEPSVLEIAEGTVTAEAPPPWRGYWWPTKGTPLMGPLTKFDTFVGARQGQMGNSIAWEAEEHKDHGVWWEGHCNGWAASAIMRSEPAKVLKDEQSGVTFSVSDLKGILAEGEYCANSVMWGERNEGEGPNPKPVSPQDFHKALTYYIGTLKKSVALNYRPDAVIDNHVVSGYTMVIKAAGANTMEVKTTLRMHRYDASRIEKPGTAPAYTLIYNYTLTTDRAGSIVSGAWKGINPGFLWVPLSTGRCEQGNPHLEEDMMNAILEL